MTTLTLVDGWPVRTWQVATRGLLTNPCSGECYLIGLCYHHLFFLLTRSDVGSDVGFEATGIIDAKLPTVGVWARATSEVSHSSLCLPSPATTF